MKNELEHLRLRCADLEKKLNKSELKRQESEDRFFKIFHASSNMMAIHTVREGRFVDLNEAAASLGGFRREDLIGHTLSEQCLVTGPNLQQITARKLYEEGRIRNMEFKVRGKEGEARTVLTSLDPITINDEPCLLAVSIDITAREERESALKKSEEKYRMLIENSLQGLSIIQDERFAFCNSAFASMTGYSVDELLAFPNSSDLLYSDDLEAVTQRHQDRMAGKPVPTSHEHRLVRKDGAIRWMEIRACLIEFNEKPAIQVASMDITERKQAEASLQRLNRELQAISDCNQTLIRAENEQSLLDDVCRIICDMAGYRMAWVGYSGNDETKPVRPMAWAGFEDGYLERADISWADTERGRGPVGTAIRTGNSVYIQNFTTDPTFIPWRENALERGYRSGIFIPLKDDASHCYGSLNIYSSEFNAFNQDEIRLLEELTGNLAYGINALRARKQRRRAEQELQEAKEYLSQLINSIRDPIFVIDRDHQFVLANDAFCQFIGTRREDLRGSSIVRFIDPDVAKVIWKQDEEMFVTERERVDEEEYPRSDGSLRTLLSLKSLLKDRDGKMQVVGVLRDITEYKKLQSHFVRAQKIQAIGTLAGGIAHDFNNILSVVIGFTQLIQEDAPGNTAIRSETDSILKACTRAKNLVKQILAFSRQNEGEKRPIRLQPVVQEAIALLRASIPATIELKCSLDPGCGPVLADSTQIHQVIMNLATNAYHSLRDTGGVIEIALEGRNLISPMLAAHPRLLAGQYAVLTVKDNGSGMSQATMQRIFEPYFTTKGSGEGTGLGLAIVHSIVDQHDGAIEVSSDLGKGTRFELLFPICLQPDPELTAEPEPRKPRGTERILFVDDEKAIAEVIQNGLKRLGYCVTTFSNSPEALQHFRQHPDDFDVVVTDLTMPKMTGMELARQICELRPHMRVVLCSGFAKSTREVEGKLAGISEFVEKPIQPERIGWAIRRVMEKR